MGNFYPGMKVNTIDLSPNYAGSLMALTNGLGALMGVAAPAFVGIMTHDVRNVNTKIIANFRLTQIENNTNQIL